jgi:hypothetical protein
VAQVEVDHYKGYAYASTINWIADEGQQYWILISENVYLNSGEYTIKTTVRFCGVQLSNAFSAPHSLFVDVKGVGRLCGKSR